MSSELETLRAEVAALAAACLACQQQVEELKEWKEAIIDAAVCDWILTKEHQTNPRKAVNDLLCWQQKIALDPAVSKEAHDLHQRAEAAEAARTALRQDLEALPRHNIVHIADLFGRREGGVDGMWISARDLADRLAKDAKS